jgi:hypothetical protein
MELQSVVIAIDLERHPRLSDVTLYDPDYIKHFLLKLPDGWKLNFPVYPQSYRYGSYGPLLVLEFTVANGGSDDESVGAVLRWVSEQLTYGLKIVGQRRRTRQSKRMFIVKMYRTASTELDLETFDAMLSEEDDDVTMLSDDDDASDDDASDDGVTMLSEEDDDVTPGEVVRVPTFSLKF